jgi:NB-ARC domain
MGNLLQASITGLAIVDQARQRRGWTKTSTARWWQEAHTSRATLRRFWQRDRIQAEIFIALCQTVGISDWAAIVDHIVDHPDLEAATLNPDHTPAAPARLIALETAPDLGSFYGREQELQQLSQWIGQERGKLVAVTGLAGIGKTSLVLALVDQFVIQTNSEITFEVIIWHSVQLSPRLQDLLNHLLAVFSSEPAATVAVALDQLFNHLRQRRCLLVLDGFAPRLPPEADRHSCDHDYGQLWQRLSRDRHQSCVVLTSRERPAEIADAPILKLAGLAEADALTLLSQQGFTGQELGLKALSRLYGGNPLALKLVTPLLQTLFNSNVASYLNQNTLVMGDRLRSLLNQQLEQLSEPAQAIVQWLAIWQEPISLSRLQTHVLGLSDGTVLESIADLDGRSLIEKSFSPDHLQLTLPPLIRQVVSDRLVTQASQELMQVLQSLNPRQFKLIRTHCLLRPGTDDIAGDHLISQIVDQLWQSGADLASALAEISMQLNPLPPFTVGYANYNLTALIRKIDGKSHQPSDSPAPL